MRCATGPCAFSSHVILELPWNSRQFDTGSVFPRPQLSDAIVAASQEQFDEIDTISWTGKEKSLDSCFLSWEGVQK